jgi:hypothetical protein
MAEHSEVKTAGAVDREREGGSERERELKTAGPGQGSMKLELCTTRWTGDSQESSGQVILRVHGPRAQVLLEGNERRREN